MSVLTITYPDTLPDASRLSRRALEREMKLALAAKLFELGRVSSGQAAELAEMNRYQFIKELHRMGVAAIDWDAEEFENERRHA